jgi:hypothetical protein
MSYQSTFEKIYSHLKQHSSAASKFEKVQKQDGTHDAMRVYGNSLKQEQVRNETLDCLASHAERIKDRDEKATHDPSVDLFINEMRDEQDRIQRKMAENITGKQERYGLSEAYNDLSKAIRAAEQHVR